MIYESKSNENKVLHIFLALFGKIIFFVILTLTLDFAPSSTTILDFWHCLNVIWTYEFPNSQKHGL